MEKINLVNSNLTQTQQERLYIEVQHSIFKKVSEFSQSKKELKDFLSLGFNINCAPNHGWTLLMMASYSNNHRFVELLIDLNANLEYQDKNGANALIVSVANQSLDCFSLLLEKKVNLNIQDKKGMTPFLYACEVGNEQIINDLMVAGADIEIKDNKGLGLIHYANQSPHKSETVQSLIEKYQLENSIDIVNENIAPKKRFKI